MNNENEEFLDAEVQDDESVTSENNDTSNSDESPEDEQSSDDEKYLNQRRRAEKAEAELKRLKSRLEGNDSPKRNESNLSNTPSALEIAKISQLVKDLDNDDLTALEQVARGMGITDLTEAAESPLFKAHLRVKKEEQRKEQAKLGASTGSGNARAKEAPFKRGMTEEEHKAQWMKSRG